MIRDCVCPRSRHEHGMRQAYLVDGCRCFHCRLSYSNSRKLADWRDPGLFVPRVGTVRRLEALHRIGWSEADLSARLGISKQAVGELRRHIGKHMLATTAQHVTAVYDELWATTPPPSRYLTRTVNWAARKGFPPPLAWDDDEIDDPQAVPHLPPASGWNLKPCGTLAAARRHYRRGEPLCGACRAAEARREDAA